MEERIVEGREVMTEADWKERESVQERNESGRQGGLESFKRSIGTNG